MVGDFSRDYLPDRNDRHLELDWRTQSGISCSTLKAKPIFGTPETRQWPRDLEEFRKNREHREHSTANFFSQTLNFYQLFPAPHLSFS
jgi:hypothetical protein